MTSIEEYHVTPMRTHGTGREGPRWSASIKEPKWATIIADVNEDGCGGELRIEFRTSSASAACFRAAVAEWAGSIAPPRHKCVDSISAWVHHQLGTPIDELVTLFFTEDLPPPTRPVDAGQLDRVLHNTLLGMSRGYQAVYSLSSRVGGCDWPLYPVLTILRDWRSQGMLDVDDWQALQELSYHQGIWACNLTSDDIDEDLSEITVLIPSIDYDADDVIPHPKALTLYYRKPIFGEPRADRGAH